MQLGCHVSIRNGFLAAARTARAIGANAFQYFPKNPRSLAMKTLDSADAAACREYCRTHGLASVAHAPYPANIAAEDEQTRAAVAASLLNDLAIADACGSVGVVVHFGTYKGKDALQGYKNSLQCLNSVLSRWEGSALVLIENQSGEGSSMGMTLDECVAIRQLSEFPEKIGFCLDTCHLFASGVWTGNNWTEVERHGEEIGYFRHLRAVHLNDSVYASGSRRDRHAFAGSGRIGEAGLKELLASRWIAAVPVLLETPKGKDGTHRGEIALIRSWLKDGQRF